MAGPDEMLPPRPLGIGRKKKPEPPKIVLTAMRWQCGCGCRNWAHRTTCASCGEARPEPVNA